MTPEPQQLGEFQQLVLLAVMRVVQHGDDAYGITVHEEIKTRADRRVARGAVYMTLDRLEKKGLLVSRVTDPTPERGGRAKRCYEVTAAATDALRASRRVLLSFWEGLELAD